MSQMLQRLAQDRHAIVGPVLAIAALPVFGMVGVAIDHGRTSHATADAYAIAQEACDRTSSAYFASMPVADRVDAAEAVIQRRTRSAPEFDHVSFSAASVGGRVEVAASGTVSTTLAGLVGIDDMEVDIHLACSDQPAAAGGPVCINLLDPDIKRSLHVHQSEVTAQGCEVHVRSDHKEAAVVHKKSIMRTSKLCVTGEIVNGPFIESDPAAPTAEFIDDGTSLIDALSLSACVTAPDPFARIAAPAVGACDFRNFRASRPTVNLSPGVYCGGIAIDAAVNARLRPGIYQIVDGPLTIAPGASVIGGDVTLVLQGNVKEISSEGATIQLSAPASGAMAGHVMFQAIGEPHVGVEFTNSSQVSLAGGVYLSLGSLDIRDSVVVPIVGQPLTIHASKLDVHKSQLTLAMN